HIGIAIVARDPMRHTVTEWVVHDMSGQLTHGPFDHGDRIDEALVSDPLWPEQPHEPRWVQLRMPQPASHEKILAAHTEGRLGGLRLCALAYFITQIRRAALVGVQVENPG